MKNKVALITGITGQDGSYLAEFLLQKKYIKNIYFAFKHIGVKIKFYGKHPYEFAKIESISKKNNNIEVGQVVIRQSKKYLRPNDVDTLLGNSKKAHKKLGWKSKISIDELCNEMMSIDLDIIKKSSN